MTDPLVDPYPIGFVFTEGAHDVPTDNFVQRLLPGGYCYSLHRRSPGVVVVDGDDFLILHGHAVCTQRNQSGQELALNLLSARRQGANSLEVATDTIAGRWALITGGTQHGVDVYHDAHGCRSVYYNVDQPLISSHARLASQVHAQKASLPSHDKTLGWLWDDTPYEDVRALLPNHTVNMAVRRPKRYWPRQVNRFLAEESHLRVNVVNDAWMAQIDHYADTESLAMSLSAGADSRVVLAMARQHLGDIDFFTYTTTAPQDNYWSRTVLTDARAVKEMSQDLGIRARMIDAADSRPLSEAQRETLRGNTLGAHGNWLLPHYLEHFPGHKYMHLRGNLLETGRSAFLAQGNRPTVEGVRDLSFRRLKKLGRMDGAAERKVQKGLEKFGYTTALYGYDPLDIFYVEARMGRWYAELLNETDAVFDTLTPFNTREMIEASLAWDRDSRVTGVLFSELINRNFPVLNFYGRNGSPNLYEELRSRRCST